VKCYCDPIGLRKILLMLRTLLSALQLSFFFVMIVRVAYVLIGEWSFERLRHKQIARTIAGLCPVCGYDARITPRHCPECGTDIENYRFFAQSA